MSRASVPRFFGRSRPYRGGPRSCSGVGRAAAMSAAARPNQPAQVLDRALHRRRAHRERVPDRGAGAQARASCRASESPTNPWRPALPQWSAPAVPVRSAGVSIAVQPRPSTGRTADRRRRTSSAMSSPAQEREKGRSRLCGQHWCRRLDARRKPVARPAAWRPKEPRPPAHNFFR